MSINKIPSGSFVTAMNFAANGDFAVTQKGLNPGGYKITAASSVTYNIIANSQALSITGSSAVYISQNTGAIVVKVTAGAPCYILLEEYENNLISLSGAFTVDTITTTSTYTGIGSGIAVMVGGGQAGFDATTSAGGNGGKILAAATTFTGNIPAVVGAGGTAPGGAGGDTTFGSFSSSSGTTGALGSTIIGGAGATADFSTMSSVLPALTPSPFLPVGAGGAAGAAGGDPVLAGGGGGGGFSGGGGGGGVGRANPPVPLRYPAGTGGGGGGYVAGTAGAGRGAGSGGNGGAGGIVIFRR